MEKGTSDRSGTGRGQNSTPRPVCLYVQQYVYVSLILVGRDVWAYKSIERYTKGLGSARRMGVRTY